YLFHDAALQVAQISQRVGKPIKLMWLREEDMKHGRNRPAAVHHIKATIRDGQVATFEHRMACPEMDVRHGLGDAGSHQYIFQATSSGHMPYNVGWQSITLQQHLLAVSSGAWRVVYSGQVCSLN